MRRLSAKQKKYLDKIRTSREVFNVNDLSDQEYVAIEEMNDSEILYQEVDRYLIDKSFEEI